MNRLIIFAPLLVLAACAGRATSPAPGIQVITKEVKVEVQRPCPAKKPVKPEMLERPLPSTAGRLVDLLTAKLAEWAGPGGYGEKADAALSICTKD